MHRHLFAAIAAALLLAAPLQAAPRLTMHRAQLAITKSAVRDQHGSTRVSLEDCHRDEVHRRIVVCWTVATYGEDEDAWLYAAGYRKGRLVACNVVFASCPWTDVE